VSCRWVAVSCFAWPSVYAVTQSAEYEADIVSMSLSGRRIAREWLGFKKLIPIRKDFDLLSNLQRLQPEVRQYAAQVVDYA
jgi:Zn-dependent protease with chaperone function